jgi:hypothetical protein
MAWQAPILVFVFLFSGQLFASEVLRVGKDAFNFAITHDDSRQWKVKDRVCVLQRAREIACGSVVKVAVKGAIVRLDQPNYDILAGDRVVSKYQAEPSGKSAAAPLIDSVPESEESEWHVLNVALGGVAGTNFFYPVVNFQVAVVPTVSLGLTGFFFNYSNELNTLLAFGGMATVNYYSQEYFRGFWVQLGGGLAAISVSGASPPESATTFAGLATVGWRGYWDLGFNIGVGAGLQLIGDPALQNTVLTSAGLKPIVVLDIGLSF